MDGGPGRSKKVAEGLGSQTGWMDGVLLGRPGVGGAEAIDSRGHGQEGRAHKNEGNGVGGKSKGAWFCKGTMWT